MAKDKELTAIEAHQQALKKETPRWYFSNPLFTVVPDEAGAGVELFPLNKSVAEKTRIIGFLDPTHPDGLSVLNALKLWQERYDHLPLEFLAVFASPQAWMQTTARRDPCIRKDRLEFPAVVDQDGDILSAFDVDLCPMIQLRTKTAVIAAAKGPRLENFEVQLQTFLRESDPGLALFDPVQLHEFQKFEAVRLPSAESWKWSGPWVHQDGTHQLHGAAGSVTIPLAGTNLWIVAESERSERIIGETMIDGAPAFEVFLDEPRLEITDPRIYRIFKNLSPKQHSMTLKFNAFKGQKLTIFAVYATESKEVDSSTAG